MANSNSSGAASGGVGLFGLLFLLFLGLKLAEIGQVAAWSWWWVTAPLWGPLAFVVVLLIFFIIVFSVAKLCGMK